MDFILNIQPFTSIKIERYLHQQVNGRGKKYEANEKEWETKLKENTRKKYEIKDKDKIKFEP